MTLSNRQNRLAFLAAILSMCLSASVTAQPTETTSPPNDKMQEFENKRQVYRQKETTEADWIYRKSQESRKKPKDRYEAFEQKRERHRKYNEYLDRLNSNRYPAGTDDRNPNDRTIE